MITGAAADVMAAHPVAAYKRVTMVINGVTKNVVVPVYSRASQQSQKDTVQSDDDECIIVDVEPPAFAASSGSSHLLPKQPVPDSVDLDVEPVEISPVSCTSGLNLSSEKTAPYCGLSDQAQNSITATSATGVSQVRSNRPTGIVNPITLNSSASTGKARTATAIVLSEAQSVRFPSAAVFGDIDIRSKVHSIEYNIQSQHAHTDLLSAIPVVIAPPPGTEVSSVSVISSPRTMTKQEAVAAGWFSDEDATDQLPEHNATAASHLTKASCDTSEVSGTLPLMDSFSVEAVVDDSFISTAEYVSLETLTGSSADLPIHIGDHVEIVPIISGAEEMPYGDAISGNAKLEIDVAVDRKPEVVSDETKLCCKLEKLFDDDGDSYDRLMNEEDEPLTAMMQAVDNDNAVHGASAKSKPVKKTAKKSEAAGRRRGRPKSKLPVSSRETGKKRDRSSSEESQPLITLMKGRDKPLEKTAKENVRQESGRSPRLKLPSSGHDTRKKLNKAKRTGGRPLTAAERYRLRTCGVWLQRLRLPAATVRTCVVWRYLCCRALTPLATGSCSLCCAKRKSDSLMELEVAQKFRAGIRHCARAVKTWQEFSVDPDLLPDSATAASSESKKYLLVRTETSTFVIPVDSAVGCIVSEQDVAKMLCTQAASSSSVCAGEFSNDALMQACSQLKQSSSTNTASSRGNKRLSAKVRNSSALAVDRRRNIGAVNPVSKRRRLSAGLVRKARRSFRGTSSMMRELRGLGVKVCTSKQQSRKVRW